MSKLQKETKSTLKRLDSVSFRAVTSEAKSPPKIR